MEIINKSIPTFLITETIQKDLKRSCEKRKFDRFWRVHKKKLVELTQYLSRIKVSGSSVGAYVCRDLGTIIELFTGKKFPKSTFYLKPENCETDFKCAEFKRSIMQCIESSYWDIFIEEYESTFNAILHLARKQNVVDILIECDGTKCSYFSNARPKRYYVPDTSESLFSTALSFARMTLRNVSHTSKSQVGAKIASAPEVKTSLLPFLKDNPPKLETENKVVSDEMVPNTTEESNSKSANDYYKMVFLEDEDEDSASSTNESSQDAVVEEIEEIKLDDDDEEEEDEKEEAPSEENESVTEDTEQENDDEIDSTISSESETTQSTCDDYRQLMENRDQQHFDLQFAELQKDYDTQLYIQKQEFERKMAKINLKTEMIREEMSIRMLGSQKRRIKMDLLLHEHPTSIFYTELELKEANRVMDDLDQRNVSFHIIRTDWDAEIRLGVKEYSGHEDFPQLFIKGVLQNLRT